MARDERRRLPSVGEARRNHVEQRRDGAPVEGGDVDGVLLAGEEPSALLLVHPVDLVEHQQPRDLVQIEIGQELLGGLDVAVAVGIARVDDLKDEVGVGRLLEGGAERGEQVLGRSRMKPTVSVITTSRSSGNRSRRVRVSRVAKSLSSASTSESVRLLRSVLLPAFV